MRQLNFYLQYAFRNLWRSRRWSTFALFSVAAGVATVVALRSLGLAIGDSLTGNVRSSMHGDIVLELGGDPSFNFGDPNDFDAFTASDVEKVEAWAAENNAKVSASTQAGNLQVTSLNFDTVGRPQIITTYFVDPQTYPPTDDIRAVEPAGVPLRDLFQGGNEIVISDNMASNQNIKLGDTVRVSGTEEEFIVRGIVPASTEAGLRNIFAAFFGFAYFDNSLKAKLPVQQDATNIAIALNNPAPAAIEQARQELDALVSTRLYYQTRTVTEAIKDNQQIADVLGSFIVVLGLGALLIGGVGIMNTMLVLMRRRTDEIAALKTFGLKGGQIAAMFMAEAVLLGVAGSLLGGVFGVLLSGLTNAYGQALIQQPLSWRIYPEAILFGSAVGILITAVFGIIPVLIAVKVRPAIILRPNESSVPRLGCLQSFGMIILVVVVLGLIAGQMLLPAFNVTNGRSPNAFVSGIIMVGATLLILGILIGMLWVIVWLIGKLPAFGFIDLRLALRNLTTHRTRTATTLLALAAGMFALSSIAFFGAGIRQLIQFTLSQQLGGNVMVFAVLPSSISNPLVDRVLSNQEGVISRTRFTMSFGVIRDVDGRTVELPDAPEPSAEYEFDGPNTIVFTDYTLQISIRDTTNPISSTGTIIAGRPLTPDDDGKPVAVLANLPRLQALNIGVGSHISVEVNDRLTAFEIVGLVEAPNGNNMQILYMGGSDLQIPTGVISSGQSSFPFTIANVEADSLNKVLLALNSIPLVYSIDVTFIDNVITRFINQMSAIPILVGILSLGAAAVIMANTVALATLERRRQIGILKAVGLKGRRVLVVMLLENTLVSLLGSLLGIGLSALGIGILTALGASITQIIPPDATPVAIALLVTAVLIAWVATFLSARTAVSERVTNVLRYE
ncbi:MAG: ABC transporter permease [Chloroflexi bacterium]|nr:ABC transporter permease [Chloroflexota bacterium]MCC6892494.1 ABC transporter permease [Anaerolineae bacterium]